jgi:hypothetical protein
MELLIYILIIYLQDTEDKLIKIVQDMEKKQAELEIKKKMKK